MSDTRWRGSYGDLVGVELEDACDHRADNLRCLCRFHNQREAERWFGKAHMSTARVRIHVP